MTMRTEVVDTMWFRIYMSGPIEVAKQIVRANCLHRGLCVTVQPTLFIYTGGEESGYVIELINYPRFPSNYQDIYERAEALMHQILEETHQHSALLMTPYKTLWISKRDGQ